MIKKIAWETFKNTGDINTYLELKQIETIEDKIENKNIITDKQITQDSTVRKDIEH